MTCWESTLGPIMNRCTASLHGRGLHATSQCRASIRPILYCTQRIQLMVAHILVHGVLKCLAQIKTAYRQQAKELHPDLNPSAGAAQHARFVEVSEAYQVARILPVTFATRSIGLMHSLASARLEFAALFKLLLGHPHMQSTTGMHATFLAQRDHGSTLMMGKAVHSGRRMLWFCVPVSTAEGSHQR